MDNKQTSIESLFEKLWDTPKDKLTWYAILEEHISMHKEEKLTDYSDGYLEGFNRALALVELTVEEYKYDIFYDRGLVKIHDRIKELKG
jgi:hypothetical protein